MNIEEINKEIDRLNKIRISINADKQQEVIDEFLKFEWLDYVIYSCGMGAYGNETHSIVGTLPNKFKCVGARNLLGCSPHYYENVYYSTTDFGFKIESSNAGLFLQFVKKYLKKVNVSNNFDKTLELHQFLNTIKK